MTKKNAIFAQWIKQVLGYEVLSEYRFAPPRKFRHDYYIPALRLAIEVEGGIYMPQARHTSGVGYARDCVKYNLSATKGIALLRYQPKDLMKQQTIDDIRAIALVREAEKATASLAKKTKNKI